MKTIQRPKTYILVFVMLVICLPILQDLTHFTAVRPLSGAIEKIRSPEFTLASWFERDFQDKKEKYINQEFGLRNILVRLHNQLCYWIFDEAYAKWVVVGKSNYLYESGYIDSYYGKDFVGDEVINGQVHKLKFLQDTLKKLGKDLIVVITPGKASFFPEYIPNRFKADMKKTNYVSFVEHLNREDVDYLDFSPWFDKMKGQTPYPLYPQYGVHWSIYGSALAADSLLKYIEVRRNTDLPDLRFAGYEQPDTLRSPDDDVYAGMNLLLPPRSYRMAYPVVEIKDDSLKSKPSAIVIADSYFWNIYNQKIFQKTFRDFKFWFYNQEVFPDHFQKQTLTSGLDLRKTIEKTDVIIILSRNSDVQRFGWGFIDSLEVKLKEGKP